MSEPVKCIVFGCPNHVGEGTFHPTSGMCMPCHNMITTGIAGPSDNFIFGLHSRMKGYREDCEGRSSTLKRVKELIDMEMER